MRTVLGCPALLRFAAVAVTVVVSCGCSGGAARLPPTDVPMTVDTTHNSTLRFSISVQVGDAPPFDAVVDTGSAGLQIAPGALPDSAFDSISTTDVRTIFGNALYVDGVVAMAKITLGGVVSTPAPIPVVRITSFSCTAANQGCDIDADAKAHFSGFSAIFGIGMRSYNSTGNIVGNPIVQLAGSPPYVVQAPAFPGGAGNLRIAPSRSEVAAFTLYQLPAEGGLAPLDNGTSSWNDLAVPACVNDLSDGTHYCGGALLDTGSPAVEVQWPAHTGNFTELAAGESVETTVGPDGSLLGDYRFTVGATPQPGLDQIYIESTNGSAQLNLGTAPFFLYDIFFDQSSGNVGFAAR